MTHSVKNTITQSEEETTTIYAALEVSNRSSGAGSWGWAIRETRRESACTNCRRRMWTGFWRRSAAPALPATC